MIEDAATGCGVRLGAALHQADALLEGGEARAQPAGRGFAIAVQKSDNLPARIPESQVAGWAGPLGFLAEAPQRAGRLGREFAHESYILIVGRTIHDQDLVILPVQV